MLYKDSFAENVRTTFTPQTLTHTYQCAQRLGSSDRSGVLSGFTPPYDRLPSYVSYINFYKIKKKTLLTGLS